MEVTASYKNTEVGRLPTSWDVVKLRDIATLSSGTTPLRSKHDAYFKGGDIHWVKTKDLTNANILETEELVTQQALNETSLSVYPEGTVLIAMYGGFNQIGRTGLLKVPATVNQAITAIHTDSSTVISRYLLEYLNYRVDYWKNVAVSSRKDPNITSRDVGRFPLALPPRPEQRAIADALSDVDALIERLDALIAKKRAIKTATMQRLLTGQQRLPGFSAPWTTKRLGKIGDWKGGGTPSKHVEAYWQGDIPWVSPKDFKGSSISDTEDYISLRAVRKSSTSLIRENSILVVARSGVLRNTIPVAQNSVPVAINQDVKALTPHSSLSPSFVFYAIKHAVPELMRSSVKTGTTVESLDFRNLSNFQVPVPSPTEQQAIATILADMDAEIEALQARRDKTQAIKQGMMQELLTGRTRLV